MDPPARLTGGQSLVAGTADSPHGSLPSFPVIGGRPVGRLLPGKPIEALSKEESQLGRCSSWAGRAMSLTLVQKPRFPEW
jgi:hypothetical protein